MDHFAGDTLAGDTLAGDILCQVLGFSGASGNVGIL